LFPVGPHSAFAVNLPPGAKRGLCAQTLRMPTAIVGQNGAQIKQATKIAVSECPRHKPPKRKQHKHPKRKRVRA